MMKMRKALLLPLLLVLALILAQSANARPLEQSVSLQVEVTPNADGTYHIRGSVVVTGLHPEGQEIVTNEVDVHAEFMVGEGSWPVFYEWWSHADTCYTIGVERCATEEELYGLNVSASSIFAQTLSDSDDGKTFSFEADVEPPDGAGQMQVVARFEHTYTCGACYWDARQYLWDVYGPIDVTAITPPPTPTPTPTPTPRPHEIAITWGPQGSLNPVSPGKEVECIVGAEDSLGHPLSYEWSVNGSSSGFDNPKKKSPLWTAPENCSDKNVEYQIKVKVSCEYGASAEGSYTQKVYPSADILSLDDILRMYKIFGTTAHTWPDGTTDKKALVGPGSCGATTNLRCLSDKYSEYCRFNCVAMQYKVLWFLNDLKRAGKLTCWEYDSVYGKSPPYWYHNAVVIWKKGKDWEKDGIILDPHGKQKPHWYSPGTWVFPWHRMNADILGVYTGRQTPWNPKGEKRPTRFEPNDLVGLAMFCPVDVLIVNSMGQRLGVLPNGEPVSEFEAIDSYFWMDEEGDKQWFFALPQDTYDVKIRGTGSGNFHLLTSPSGEEIHDYGDNPIAAGEQATLTMNPEEDELTLADGSKPMFEVIPLESEPLTGLIDPIVLVCLFGTAGMAGLVSFALLLFFLARRRRPAPAVPLVTPPRRPPPPVRPSTEPLRPRGRPEEFVDREPPGPPESLD